MPKTRETCTRCSMRRQKCDREEPCNRCIAAGVGAACTREWKDGYDPAVHRRYPRTRNRRSRTISSRSNEDRIQQWLPLAASQGARSPDDTAIEVGNSSVHSEALDARDAHARRDIHEVLAQLPTRFQMLSMVTYFEDHLSWYTWCISIPQFKKEFDRAFLTSGDLRPTTLDLRWVALLWAVLCVSLTCADAETIKGWGLSSSKQTLSQQWYHQSLNCLNAARFMAYSHVSSLQTILTLSLSGHLLGHSSEIFTLFGVGIRLAQKLSFHRLSYDGTLDEISTENSREQIMRREVGRRIWQQLCIHDDNSTVATRMQLLRPADYTAISPRALDIYYDDRLTSSAADSYASNAIWMKDVSRIVAECFHVLNASSSEEEKFQQIIMLDGKLRAIPVPEYSNVPWARWARQEAAIIRNNKVGFIHRYFFGKSFSNPAYKYSRWASIDAARELIQEIDISYKSDGKRPIFWNDHAHTIGACITLCLDNQHRNPDEHEFQQNRQYLDRAVALFHKHKDSSLAANGIRVVSSLIKGRAATQQDGEELTWPLENREAIDSLLENGVSQHRGTFSAQAAAPGPVEEDIFADLSWMDVFGAEGFDDFLTNENLWR